MPSIFRGKTAQLPLNTIKSTRLDRFLREQKAESKDIYFQTSISIGKLSHLRLNRVNLYIYDFYLIGKSIHHDINEMAQDVFSDYDAEIEQTHQSPKNSRRKGKLGKFGQIISQYLNSQSSLAQAIGMDKNKFSRLMYSDSEIIALDLYILTKLLNLDFKLVTEAICGHLHLNSEEEQQRLRDKYQAELNVKKAKRDANKRQA